MACVAETTVAPREARRIAANIAKLRELLRKPRASIRPTSAMTSTPDVSLHCGH
jgi:hypothetical protein